MATRRPLVNIAGVLQEMPASDYPLFPSQAQANVFAAPSGSAGEPTFRTLVSSDIPSLSYAPTIGSVSITTLGTISTGTWNASLVNSTYGGTGVNNGGRTITYAGNLTWTGAFTFTGALSGITSVTFPTSGTLLSTASLITVPQGGTGVATITGLVKGNGTGALSAAVVRTDYAEPTTALATGLLKNTTTTGAHSIATPGTDYLAPDAIGVTVQAYDADLTTWGGKTAPTGVVVGTTDTQTLTGKSLQGAKEVSATLSGTTPVIGVSNGTLLTWALTGNSTPTTTLADGEYVHLKISDGTAYTITWTSVGVVWKDGTAPTLATTGFTEIALWKQGTVIHGAKVGDFAS